MVHSTTFYLVYLIKSQSYAKTVPRLVFLTTPSLRPQNGYEAVVRKTSLGTEEKREYLDRLGIKEVVEWRTGRAERGEEERAEIKEKVLSY